MKPGRHPGVRRKAPNVEVKNVILAVGFVACVMVAARGVALLPQAMQGQNIGPVHIAEEVLLETLKGEF